MPAPPSYNKVNPADQPIFFLTLSSPTLPLSQVNEYAETILAQRISMVNGVAQVSVFGAQKFAVRVDLDPLQLAVARHRRRRGRDGDPARQREPADRHALRREPELHGLRRERPAVQRRGVRPAHRRLPGRPAGPAERDRARLRRRRERQDGELGRRHARDLPGDPAPAGHQHRRGRRRRSRRCCRAAGAAAGVGQAGHPQRPLAVDSRVGARRQVHAGADGRARRPGHLPVPAEPLGDADSRASRCRRRSSARSRRCTCSDYSLDNLSLMALTLSVGFVVDDAIVMLENIVRHMEQGESADGSRAQGRAGDRVHDRLDDAVARRGVHPRAVHGRHRRPAAARVRGDDQRRDSRLGLRLDQPDADAVRALAPPGHAPAPRPRLHGRSSTFFEWSRQVLRLDAARDAAATSAVTLAVVVRCCSARRSICSASSRRASSRRSTPARSTATTEFAQGIGFDAMVAHQKQVADIIKADPNVLQFTSNIGSGGRRRGQQPGPASASTSSRSRERTTDGRRGDRRSCAARSPASGRARVPAESAGDPHRRADRRAACTSTRCRASTRPRSTSSRRSSSRRCARCRASWTSRATCSSPTRRSTSQLDRDRDRARSASRSIRSRPRWPTRTARSQVSTIYAPTNEYQVHHARRAGVPGPARRAVAALRASRQAARWCRSTRSRASSRASARSRSITPGSCRR